MKLVPIAGWTAAGVTDLFQGQLLRGLLYLGANLVPGICIDRLHIDEQNGLL